jgi:WD repeat-containing protein 23
MLGSQWMIYSSITPYVYLVPTRTDADGGANDRQVLLDFSGGSDDSGVRYHSRQAVRAPSSSARRQVA